MMKKYIPEEITEAKKQGFSSPDASWFKGESIEYFKKSILSKSVYVFMTTWILMQWKAGCWSIYRGKKSPIAYMVTPEFRGNPLIER